MWTEFWDMSTGPVPGTKVGFKYIFIQAGRACAITLFKRLFGYDPEQHSCPCCGQDFGIYEDKTLRKITAYHRHEYEDPYMRERLAQHLLSIAEFTGQDNVLVLRKGDITRFRRRLRNDKQYQLPKKKGF